MPRRASLYLDTSVPNALFKEPERRKEITEGFFQHVIPRYDVSISELVIAEIEATPEDKLRNILMDKVKEFLILPISPQAEELAKEYTKYLKIPWRDALHIGISTVEGTNYLVTWNMEHLAKERTRRIVDNVNFLRGLTRLYVVTPDDFFD